MVCVVYLDSQRKTNREIQEGQRSVVILKNSSYVHVHPTFNPSVYFLMQVEPSVACITRVSVCDNDWWRLHPHPRTTSRTVLELIFLNGLD